MTNPSTDTHPWTERFKGALWLAPILFALAGWMVVGKLPPWIVGLVVAAGVALGALGEEMDPSNRVIVDFRNQTLARFVDESTSDKIYITYGAAHFPGFLAELQQRDPKFTIRSVKRVRPMTQPDEPNLAPAAVTGQAN